MKRLLFLTLAVYYLFSTGDRLYSQLSEAQVKAAFIEKFTHFIDWPDDSVTHKPFVIFVFPDSPMLPYLKQLLSNHRIKNKPVEILVSENLMLLDSANIAIFHSAQQNLMPTIRSIIRDKPILTIGDYPGFLDDGGILLLYREENTIHFSINIKALAHTGLVVSSQLLKLAKIYQSDE